MADSGPRFVNGRAGHRTLMFTARRYRTAAPRTRRVAGVRARALPARLVCVGQIEHGVSQPPREAVVVHELLEQFGVVLQYGRRHARQDLVVLNPSVCLSEFCLAFSVRLSAATQLGWRITATTPSAVAVVARCQSQSASGPIASDEAIGVNADGGKLAWSPSVPSATLNLGDGHESNHR